MDDDTSGAVTLRGLSVTLVVALLLQFGGAAWWAASLTTRVEGLAVHLTETNEAQQSLQAEVARLGRSDVSVTRQIEALQSSLNQIRTDVRDSNAMLRRLLENGAFRFPTP